RPRVFDDLIGQEAIAQTLRHAVASGRTASVYLFAGSHGVGKTSVARIFAKALNCPNSKDGAPCGTCEVCESIARGDCMDVVEIDAASNSKVEDVRILRDSVSYKPASCKFKVYILDEVHRLSTSAFDALLKTFEESPSLVRFVLATTELHKVPTTILSRAQVFRFQRAGLDDIVRSPRPRLHARLPEAPRPGRRARGLQERHRGRRRGVPPRRRDDRRGRALPRGDRPGLGGRAPEGARPARPRGRQARRARGRPHGGAPGHSLPEDLGRELAPP